MSLAPEHAPGAAFGGEGNGPCYGCRYRSTCRYTRMACEQWLAYVSGEQYQHKDKKPSKGRYNQLPKV